MAFEAEAAAVYANDDMQLQTKCRQLLHEMAQSGNPAANDHEALLADVELMVRSLSGNSCQINQGTDASIGQMGLQFNFPGFTEDQLCYEMDWVNLLNLYSQEV